MNARILAQPTTSSGAPLPLPALPQDKILTVNIEQIPLIKDVFPGIHIKPLRLDLERGEWVFMAIIEPGVLEATALFPEVTGVLIRVSTESILYCGV